MVMLSALPLIPNACLFRLKYSEPKQSKSSMPILPATSVLTHSGDAVVAAATSVSLPPYNISMSVFICWSLKVSVTVVSSAIECIGTASKRTAVNTASFFTSNY